MEQHRRPTHEDSHVILDVRQKLRLGKRQHLQPRLLGQLDVPKQKNQIIHVSLNLHKYSPRVEQDLNLKPETLKLLEGNRQYSTRSNYGEGLYEQDSLRPEVKVNS